MGDCQARPWETPPKGADFAAPRRTRDGSKQALLIAMLPRGQGAPTPRALRQPAGRRIRCVAPLPGAGRAARAGRQLRKGRRQTANPPLNCDRVTFAAMAWTMAAAACGEAPDIEGGSRVTASRPPESGLVSLLSPIRIFGDDEGKTTRPQITHARRAFCPWRLKRPL